MLRLTNAQTNAEKKLQERESEWERERERVLVREKGRDSMMVLLQQDIEAAVERERDSEKRVKALEVSLSIHRERVSELERERDEKERERERLESEITQLQSRIQDYRDITLTLQDTLQTASIREEEHTMIVSKYNEIIDKREREIVNGLERERLLRERVIEYEREIVRLKEEARELQNVYEQMNCILNEMKSPIKQKQSNRGDIDSGKENQRSDEDELVNALSMVLSLSPSRTSATTNTVPLPLSPKPVTNVHSEEHRPSVSATATSSTEVEEEEEEREAWHESMLAQSLSLHEQLALAYADARTTGAQGISFSQWRTLCVGHHTLHELLMRAPWIEYTTDGIPTLTPAHLLFVDTNTTSNTTGVNTVLPVTKTLLPESNRDRGSNRDNCNVNTSTSVSSSDDEAWKLYAESLTESLANVEKFVERVEKERELVGPSPSPSPVPIGMSLLPPSTNGPRSGSELVSRAAAMFESLDSVRVSSSMDSVLSVRSFSTVDSELSPLCSPNDPNSRPIGPVADPTAPGAAYISFDVRATNVPPSAASPSPTVPSVPVVTSSVMCTPPRNSSHGTHSGTPTYGTHSGTVSAQTSFFISPSHTDPGSIEGEEGVNVSDLDYSFWNLSADINEDDLEEVRRVPGGEETIQRMINNAAPVNVMHMPRPLNVSFSPIRSPPQPINNNNGSLLGNK